MKCVIYSMMKLSKIKTYYNFFKFSIKEKDSSLFETSENNPCFFSSFAVYMYFHTVFL